MKNVMKLKMTAAMMVLGCAIGSASVSAAPGGPIDTLLRGEYVCGMPGTAKGKAWQVMESASFVIINGSSYRTDAGRGTYLLTGNIVRFTRGPMKGQKFVRETEGRLRLLGANGEPDRLRCNRQLARR